MSEENGKGWVHEVLNKTFSDGELESMKSWLGRRNEKINRGQTEKEAAREAARNGTSIPEAIANVRVTEENKHGNGCACCSCAGDCITVPFRFAGEHKGVAIPCCSATVFIGALATYGGVRLIEAASPYFPALHLIH